MSWTTWYESTSPEAIQDLSDKIFNLMREVVYELDDPGMDEWFEAGISIEGGEEEYEIIVYREMQETAIDGEYEPGYTLTLQLPDGQQETQAFYDDGDEDWWARCANYFARYVVDCINQ